MKIVICEDEQHWIEALKTAVSKWAAIKKIDFHCSCFTSPQELANYLKVHTDIDVLFLDISFGDKVIDGLSLAKYIRKTGSTIPIIFVTGNSLRAADGYLVEAMGYLTKPINEARLALFLDRIIKRQKRLKGYKIMSEGRITIIYQKDILYLEMKDHIVEYHTAQNVLTQRATLGEVIAVLDRHCFVQIHRSYVIALDNIDGIKSTYPYSVTLIKTDGPENLPVSRKYIGNLLEVYSDDLLEKMI